MKPPVGTKIAHMNNGDGQKVSKQNTANICATRSLTVLSSDHNSSVTFPSRGFVA